MQSNSTSTQRDSSSDSARSTIGNEDIGCASHHTEYELPIEAAALAAQGTPASDRLLERLTAHKQPSGARRIIYNFTPSWFVVTMGTGVASIILHQFPYNGDWLYWLSVVVFALNALLFVTFLAITILRYALYPEIWPIMLSHPQQSLFISCFTVGFSTIIDMMVLVCVPAWGDWVVTWVWTLWWIDAVLSLAVCYWLPFHLIRNHKNQLSSINCVWLLPTISAIVAASSGGSVASVLKPDQAVWTVVVSWVLWGSGVPLAFIILAMYFQRLSLHNIPARDIIVSAFLPLGPLGQGGHGIQQLGLVALKVFPQTSTLPAARTAGEIFYVMGWLTGLIMWAFACLWLVFAITMLVQTKRFPFNLGWWAITFPTGVFTLSTIQLGEAMPSVVFNVLGMIFGVCNIMLWLACSGVTIWKAANGELFTTKARGHRNNKEDDGTCARDSRRASQLNV